MKDDGDGSDIPVPSETAGPVYIMFSGPGGRFSDSTPSNASRSPTERPLGEPPSPGEEPQMYRVSLLRIGILQRRLTLIKGQKLKFKWNSVACGLSD